MNEKVMTLEEVRDDMAARLAEHRHPWLEEVAVWRSALDAAIRERDALLVEFPNPSTVAPVEPALAQQEQTHRAAVVAHLTRFHQAWAHER